MVLRRADDIAWSEVTADGASKCRMRELLTASDLAPTFAMRQFAVEPGGCTPYHSHPWEHEVFILSGSGAVRTVSGDVAVAAGNAVLVPPDELHSFRNTGNATLVFLCMIPVERACCR
jgi:quercetin dioxygenase-like cupin family protein